MQPVFDAPEVVSAGFEGMTPYLTKSSGNYLLELTAAARTDSSILYLHPPTKIDAGLNMASSSHIFRYYKSSRRGQRYHPLGITFPYFASRF
jgi:hypothetical protein